MHIRRRPRYNIWKDTAAVHKNARALCAHVYFQFNYCIINKWDDDCCRWWLLLSLAREHFEAFQYTLTYTHTRIHMHTQHHITCCIISYIFNAIIFFSLLLNVSSDSWADIEYYIYIYLYRYVWGVWYMFETIRRSTFFFFFWSLSGITYEIYCKSLQWT